MMDKISNPWTGKARTTKGAGMFNYILFKHYPNLEQKQEENPYIEMASIIASQTVDMNF